MVVEWRLGLLLALGVFASSIISLMYYLRPSQYYLWPSQYYLPSYSNDSSYIKLPDILTENNSKIDINDGSTIINKSSTPQWTWLCQEDRCVRMLASESTPLQSLPTCNMLCAPQIWPQPTDSLKLASTAIRVDTDHLTLEIKHSPSKEVADHLTEAFGLLREDLARIERSATEPIQTSSYSFCPISVQVIVENDEDPRLRLDTNETYTLILKRNENQILVKIKGYSFCGVRHGFETLSQLIWLDPYIESLLILESATVEDTPRFHYRGLELDTARNFFPVEDIIRTIDAMAASKLNTFHWHISDSQSFPLELESVPELARYGAYGPGAVYTTEQVRKIVRHARLRGIRVLIEVDAPAHVGFAWSFGPDAGLNELAYCVEEEPWKSYCGEPPCGQLNPKNDDVYSILEKIYAEIIALTGVDDVFHIGGDEVNKNCWAKNINNSNSMDLWGEFTGKAMKALERANGGKLPDLTILWSSRNTQYLNNLDKNKLGIQIWGVSHWPDSLYILDSGYRSIISHVNAWYLDCGFGSWRDATDGACGNYWSWQHVYNHRPWGDITPGKDWYIEGGEACLWTETVSEGGLDARLWPRAAAAAERLWTDKIGDITADVYLRLDTHRSRLVARGVKAAPLWNRWCSDNPGFCL